jgi:hypothetical protein
MSPAETKFKIPTLAAKNAARMGHPISYNVSHKTNYTKP